MFACDALANLTGVPQIMDCWDIFIMMVILCQSWLALAWCMHLSDRIKAVEREIKNYHDNP